MDRFKKSFEQALTAFKAMFKRCHSPFCENPLEPSARGQRRYCCDQCRLDNWAVKRAAELLSPFGAAKGWEILKNVLEKEPDEGEKNIRASLSPETGKNGQRIGLEN